MGCPNVELFLSHIEHEIFKEIESSLVYSNRSHKEWKIARSSTYDFSVIKKADKVSCVVVWDRKYYIMGVENQINDKGVYKDGTFDKNMIPNLIRKSNRLFESFKQRQVISKKEFFESEKTCCPEKLYLIPKIQKQVWKAPRQ